MPFHILTATPRGRASLALTTPRRGRAVQLFLLAVVLFVLEGCGASLAQPFDSMKAAPITAYRLQNYEPPAPPPNAPAQQGTFQLPPQIQQWITAGAAMLPPGLVPPGMLPGGAAPPPPQQSIPRFHDFRILGWQNVTDTKTHEEVLDIFGHESNFETPRESCMFAEFGFSIAQVNQPPADILVSLSCNQIRSFGFAWPHGSKTGMSADTAKRIIAVMHKNFGGG